MRDIVILLTAKGDVLFVSIITFFLITTLAALSEVSAAK